MRRKVILTTTLACALALPASALGATISVDGTAGADTCTRGGAVACKTIAKAASLVQTGDTITIGAGSYPESVDLPATAANVTVTGAGPTATIITGTPGNTGTVLKADGDAVSISNLQVNVTSDGGAAVEVTGGSATTLAGLFLFRTHGTTTNAPVLSASGAGLLTLSGSVLQQTAGAAANLANVGVLSTGTGGVAALDDTIVSTQGPALRFQSSDANTIVRTAAVTTLAGTNVVEISSAANSATAKKLAIDSSSLAGTGAAAAGVFAQTLGTTPIASSTAGPITIDARYLTTAGQGKGIVLDSSAAVPAIDAASTGAISATVKNSIVHGPSRVLEYAGADPGIPGDCPLLCNAANNSSLTFANTDAPAADVTAPTSPIKLGDVNGVTGASADSALFINLAAKNLHLRQDAPVIDKAPVLAGGSDKDVDGQPRAQDGIDDDLVAQPDLGADEALNLPPTAKVIAGPTFIRQTGATGFDASSSVDPEAGIGGGIVSYQWTYGDGSSDQTLGPISNHVYNKIGTFQASVKVVDKVGAVSLPSNVITVTVSDGLPPLLSITKPTASLKVNRTKKLLGFGGRVSDQSGVKSVEISVRVVKRASRRVKVGKKTRVIKPKTLPKGTCEYFTGKLAIVKRKCATPLFFRAKVLDFTWTYSVLKAVKLPVGSYEVRARATDIPGNQTKVFTRAAKTLIPFSVTG
jgi:hypothetical protein